MTADRSPVARRPDPVSHAPWSGIRRPSRPPAPLRDPRSLSDELDGLIHDLFDCGFSIAGIQGRHGIDVTLDATLNGLIGLLDDTITQIRHALCAATIAGIPDEGHGPSGVRAPGGAGEGGSPEVLHLRLPGQLADGGGGDVLELGGVECPGVGVAHHGDDVPGPDDLVAGLGRGTVHGVGEDHGDAAIALAG